MNRNFTFLIALVLFNCTDLFAQRDSLIFKNNDTIVGELKSMENSVIVVKTKYSDSDFKIKWRRVKQIYSERAFLISLSDGRKYHGSLSSISETQVKIIELDQEIICELEDIVYLTQIKQKFSDRFYASIDLGFSLAKANELRQISSRTNLGYRAENWSTNFKFNTIMSSQVKTESIRRTEGSINERYLFQRNWYSIFTISLLSNTEQKLDIRMNAQLGMGHFLVRTNSI